MSGGGTLIDPADERRWQRCTLYDLQSERQAELAYGRALVKMSADELAVMTCRARVVRLEEIILARGHRPDA